MIVANKNGKTVVNRNGLHLLIGERKIVEIDYIDMDLAGGRVVLNSGKAYEPETQARYGENITVWLPDIETAEEIEEVKNRDGYCEIIVKPFRQPDGRLFGRITSLLG